MRAGPIATHTMVRRTLGACGVVSAPSSRYSLTLIFESPSENANETDCIAYHGYVAPVCTLGPTHGARSSQLLGRGRSLLRRLVAVLSGAALLAGIVGDAEAYVVKRTTRGELVHWERAEIGYTVDPSIDRNVDRASNAIVHAMASWSGTVGAPELTVAAPTTDAPTRPGFDEKNGIFFAAAGYRPAGRALAITVLTYDNATGRILDSDVIFNGVYSFQVLDPPGDLAEHSRRDDGSTHPSNTDGIVHDDAPSTEEVTDTYDLHHVIAHELGHSLGMNDEMGKLDALMYRYSAPNDATIRAPASDDIAGLAELYSTRLEGRGNGCGSATVAPKKPSDDASHAAAYATLGLLVFLVLRAKNDRRARLGFVVVAVGATIGFVPTLSGRSGVAIAADAQPVHRLGHARAHVVSTSMSVESGLFKTTYELATTNCRAASCPKSGRGAAWGGTIGKVTQEVGNVYAPTPGSDVDVSFKTLPNAIAALTKPLAGRLSNDDSAEVRVLTLAK